MNNNTPMSEIILEAENSVSSMTDPDLKKEAFKIVLSELIQSRIFNNKSNQKATKKTSSISKSRNQTNKSIVKKDRKLPSSNISLDTNQLQSLKQFYEKKAPSSEADAVFALSSFIDDKLGKSIFHGGDIKTVYHNLLSMKPSVKPPALDDSKITRALSWLFAPSRNKMWLEKADEEGSFSISANGKIQLAYSEKQESK